MQEEGLVISGGIRTEETPAFAILYSKMAV